jgi:serine/threonine protein kinase
MPLDGRQTTDDRRRTIMTPQYAIRNTQYAIDAPSLKAVLQEGLSAYFGAPQDIQVLRYEEMETLSTHPIYSLFVRLGSGENLKVVFKQLFPDGEGWRKGNRREVVIYRELLSGGRFCSPQLYASLYDEQQERYWLFLEDVGEWTLDEAGNDEWLAAITWLADLHSAYWGRQDYLATLPYLTKHDRGYYLEIANAARRNLQLGNAQDRLARFDKLMGRFSEIVEHMADDSTGKTLVHGDIFPKNILVQPESRVRVVDWESAGVGLAAWDLVRLLDGWDKEEERRDLINLYLGEVGRHTGMIVDRSRFDAQLLRCEMLNALWHLGWSVEDCEDPPFVNGLLDEIESLWTRLDAQGEGAHDA